MSPARGVLPAGCPASLPSGVVPAELTALAERAARAAGELITTGRPARLGVSATKSSPTDVVTEMDTAAERLLRGVLSAARPGDAVLGEEGGGSGGGGSDGVTWVLDPIDGTVNYLYGLPAYAVSVAAVVGDPTVDGAWQPVAGCVHNPATGETWTATAGEGAWLDGERLDPLPAPPPLEQVLVATGFGYRPERRSRQARVLADLLPRVRDVRRAGSAALDLCGVASGRLDGYYERGLNVWDLAAAALVVTEAGGVVAGLRGRPPGGAMVVAGPHGLVAQLAARLERLGADADDAADPGPVHGDDGVGTPGVSG